MNKLVKIVGVSVLVVSLAACARFETSNVSTSTFTPSTPSTAPTVSNTKPSDSFEKQEILDFLPNEIVASLSQKDRSEAASAQFFALQYGRVGAFREWAGDSAVKGEISVGPYIEVNKLDCREFSHTVIQSGQRYTKSGTSCREANGQWRVVG